MTALTPQQRQAVEHNGNLLLTACPGSGKTRVIMAKLLLLAEQLEDTPRSVGCITYTNAAVEEIESRIKQNGSQSLLERCEIATIHAFCLRFILKPYCWLIPELPDGFKVLTREMSLFDRLVRTVEDEIGRAIQFRTFEDYASLRVNTEGRAAGVGIDGGIVSEANAERYWELMRRNGYIDFAMILFYSLRILREHSFVGRGLSSKFAWLLVDEFQDTTDVQIAILGELERHLRSRFFLVGDENQSINGFAGARPDLGQAFAIDVQAEQNLALTGNFRCAPQIVSPAEALTPRMPAMHSAGAAANVAGTVEYRHVQSPIVGITDYFLPLLEAQGIPLGKAAIVAPWWRHLIPVARRLREFDVPVFGPGARPYQRRRLYAVLAEQLGAAVEAQNLSQLPGVEKAIFRLVSEAMGQTRFDIFSYSGRCSALSLVYAAQQSAIDNPGGLSWLRASALIVGDILVRDEWIDRVTATALTHSVEEIAADMARNDVDVENLQIADLGLFANPDDALKLITLHNSKGREYEAVAIIHANEGNIPHFAANTQSEFDEARRLFYVGITRAKRHLMVFSDQTHYRNVPSRFIREAGLA